MGTSITPLEYSQHSNSLTWKIMCDLKELASLYIKRKSAPIPSWAISWRNSGGEIVLDKLLPHLFHSIWFEEIVDQLNFSMWLFHQVVTGCCRKSWTYCVLAEYRPHNHDSEKCCFWIGCRLALLDHVGQVIFSSDTLCRHIGHVLQSSTSDQHNIVLLKKVVDQIF